MNDAFANCAAIFAGIPGMLGEFPGTDNKPPAEIKRNHLRLLQGSYRQECVKFKEFSKTFLLFSRTKNLRKY